MREAVSAESLISSRHLDRVSELAVGSGHLDLDIFARGDLAGGLAGGSLSYDHHVREDLSLFGEGWLGYGFGDRQGFEYGVSAGLRWRF